MFEVVFDSGKIGVVDGGVVDECVQKGKEFGAEATKRLNHAGDDVFALGGGISSCLVNFTSNRSVTRFVKSTGRVLLGQRVTDGSIK